MPLLFPLLVSTLLFATGVYGVLARRNAVLVLMGVELMLNAVNLNLLAFDAWHRDGLHSGQIMTLFVITIAAAEIGLGLAIVLLLFRTRAQIDVNAVRDLADRDTTDEAEVLAAEAADADAGGPGSPAPVADATTPVSPSPASAPATGETTDVAGAVTGGRR